MGKHRSTGHWTTDLLVLLSPAWLVLILFSCGPAPDNAPVSRTVVGAVRFQERSNQLTAEVLVDPTDTTLVPPTFLGTALQPTPNGPNNRFVGSRTLPLPAQLTLGLPNDHTLSFPPYLPDVASLPDTLRKTTDLYFRPLPTAPDSTQNLIVFFEPDDRRLPPRRILVDGPIADPDLRIPATAFTDLVPASYRVYLIGQQLLRDSLPGLRYSIQAEYFSDEKPVLVVD